MATHRHHHMMLNYWTTKPQITYSYLQVRPLVVYHEESVIKVRYKPCDVRSSYNPSLSVVCSLHWIAFVYESFVDAIFNLTQCSILFHSSASIVRVGEKEMKLSTNCFECGWRDDWIGGSSWWFNQHYIDEHNKRITGSRKFIAEMHETQHHFLLTHITTTCSFMCRATESSQEIDIKELISAGGWNWG